MSLSKLLLIERVILKKSGKIEVDGTNSIMSDFIAEQEKTIWMLKAWQKDLSYFDYLALN